MKIWPGYGSEHSANLVMIGRFRTTVVATKAKELIDMIAEQASADAQADLIKAGQATTRFSEAMLKLLESVRIYSISPAELDQFASEVSVKLEGETVVVTT